MKKAQIRSQVDDVAEALKPILEVGLPIYPDYNDERLLSLSCVTERCLDPTNRLNRIKAADGLLSEVIKRYPSDELGEAVSHLFGAADGSRVRSMTKRRQRALDACYLNDEGHFHDVLEPKILRTIAWQLVQRTLGTSAPLSAAESLSPESLQAARHVYRHAQRTLVCVDAFDLCVSFAYVLHAAPSATLPGFAGVTPDSHLWIRQFSYRDHVVAHPERHDSERETYGDEDVDAHLVAYGRSRESDSGLTAFACYHEHLRALLRDPAGHDFILETAPSVQWDAVRSGIPLTSDDIDTLMAVRALTNRRDTASDYVTNLLSAHGGRTTHAKWLELLCAPVPNEGDTSAPQAGWLERKRLSKDLLALCTTMQHLFPDETLSDVSSNFEDTVSHVLSAGLRECGAPVLQTVATKPGQGYVTFTADALQLYHDILARQPLRYSHRSLEAGDTVWTADPPPSSAKPRKDSRRPKST